MSIFYSHSIQRLKNFCFFLAAVCTLALFAACTNASPGLPADATSTPVVAAEPLLVIGQGYEGVILPPNAGPAFGFQNLTFWMPEESQIQALEAEIENYLGLRGLGPFGFKIREYKRQYLGVEENGQKLIYANFFCDALGIDWQKEPVIIADGGSCYFQVRFNPETGEFTDLQFNGEA